MALLGVKGVPGHAVLTEELGVVRPGHLQFSLLAVKDVDVLVVVEVGDGVGEVLVGKNPDDRLCIHDRLFRGFRVVKYDPRNPDPGPLNLGENVLIGVPFQIVKFQAGVFPFGQQDILDEHDLTDFVKVEDGLKLHGQLDLDLVAPEEGRRSHGLVVGGEDHRSAAVLLVRLVLAVNPPVTPDTKYFCKRELIWKILFLEHKTILHEGT